MVVERMTPEGVLLMPSPRKLTVSEWGMVFQLRCRSKQGQEISEEDHALVDAAFHEDPERYSELEADVFDATVPFGSVARWRRMTGR